MKPQLKDFLTAFAYEKDKRSLDEQLAAIL